MGIVDEDIARVRDATDMVQLVSQYVGLKRVGRRWVGLCPFHQENTASFGVNAELGLYHCFGCGVSGDAITFLREIEHLDFVGAVEQLANRAGVTLRYTEAHQGESRKARARLVEVVRKAADYYHDRLLTGSDAGAARAYLRERGFDGDLVRQYQLGWAPDRWDDLARHLRLPDQVLIDSGLGFVNRVGKQQDFFRARVLFPIADAQGDSVGFGGRKLPGADGPKYRNTSETQLYRKSRVLYGLDRSKTEIVQLDQAIICEGYTDVIGFARAELPIAVATCGTALTEDHVKILRRFTRRLLLAFDPDAAGQAAAERVYEWERAHDLEVSVVALPAGDDPADLAQRDPEALRTAVASAQRFLGFRVERSLAGADLTTPEGRARAVDQALAMVAEHPDELVRDPYVMLIADRCRLDGARLRARVDHFRDHPPPKMVRSNRARSARMDEPEQATGRPQVAKPFRPTAESEALRVAVHRPESIMATLAEPLFVEPSHLALYRALRDSGGDARAATATLDPEPAALLARLAVEETEAEPDDVLVRLAERAGQRALTELEREARASDDPLAWSPVIAWLKLRLEELRDEHSDGRAVVAQLVAWLSERDAERE